MAILSNGKFYGFLCSVKETGQKLANGAKEYVEDFVSGFAGHGWKLWEYVKGKWMLEIDSIRVRGQFTVFEMLISKVRAIIGAQAITQGCGKVKNVALSEDGAAYLITLEDTDMSFMEHDFIRCQVFSGGQKNYHVEIESVENGVIKIPLSEFDLDEEGVVMNPPAAGDDIVQFGNSSHDEKYVGRHSAIYMHADEGLPPAIDVLDEIYSKDWSKCVKVRMGGDIPEGGGARGFYSVNGMIKGVDESGHVTYCLYPDGTAELGDNSALFRPDKSGYIAGGAIAWTWDDKRGKHVCMMKDVVLTWDNLDDEVKENLKGEVGDKGEPGINGADGITYYLHVKYSDDGGGTFTADNGETSGTWIGVCTNTDINDPSNVEAYKWSRIKGDTGEPGQDANLLDWVQEYEKNKTQIGEDYFISPKLFSGTNSGTAENPILTGVAMGFECITINGEKKTGIFAVVDNDPVFELDPVNRSYKFKGEINAEKGNIGGFNIGSTGLYNKENRDCYVEMTNREYIGYKAGKEIFSERKAVLGNSLVALTGLQEVARMSYTGEEYETHRVLGLVATGSTMTHNIFGGYDNLCVDAIGGCNWIQNKGDHWCMPGVLGIIRFSCSFSNNTYIFGYEKVWGNGIPDISKSYINNTNDKVMVIEMDMGHGEYSVVGQAIGATAKEGYWDLTPHIEYLVPGGFGISVWHNNAKYIPSLMDMMIFGRPYTKA